MNIVALHNIKAYTYQALLFIACVKNVDSNYSFFRFSSCKKEVGEVICDSNVTGEFGIFNATSGSMLL